MPKQLRNFEISSSYSWLFNFDQRILANFLHSFSYPPTLSLIKESKIKLSIGGCNALTRISAWYPPQTKADLKYILINFAATPWDIFNPNFSPAFITFFRHSRCWESNSWGSGKEDGLSTNSWRWHDSIISFPISTLNLQPITLAALLAAQAENLCLWFFIV